MQLAVCADIIDMALYEHIQLCVWLMISTCSVIEIVWGADSENITVFSFFSRPPIANSKSRDRFGAIT
jgi:hypothetical protein